MNTNTVNLGAAGVKFNVNGECRYISLKTATGAITFRAGNGDQFTLTQGGFYQAPGPFQGFDLWSSAPNDVVTFDAGLGMVFNQNGAPGGGAVPVPLPIIGQTGEGVFVPLGTAPILVGGVDAGHAAADLQVVDDFAGGIFFGQKNLAAAPAKLNSATPVFPTGGNTQNLPLYSAKTLSISVVGLAPGDVYLFLGRLASGSLAESLVWRDKTGGIVNSLGQITTDGVYHADVTRYNYMDVDGTGVVAPGGLTVNALLSF